MKYLNTGKCLDEACKLKHITDIGSLEFRGEGTPLKSSETQAKKVVKASILDKKYLNFEEPGKVMADGFTASSASREEVMAFKAFKKQVENMKT